MIFFERPYVTIEYIPEDKLSLTTWKGFANSDQYREAVNAGIDLLRKHDVLLAVSDNTNMKAIRPADQDWVNEVALPEALKISKITRSATVVSTDIFNRMAMDRMLSRIESPLPLEYEFFDNIEDAMAWVKKT